MSVTLEDTIWGRMEEFNEEVLSVLEDGIGTYCSLIASDQFSDEERRQFDIDLPWVLVQEDDQGFKAATPISEQEADGVRQEFD